jgi:Bacterial lipocalin
MKLTRSVAIGVLSLVAIASATAAPNADNAERKASVLPATVTELDLSLFDGKWFELARIPIPIGRDWVNTRDIYIKNSDGTWSVRYEGNKGSSDGPGKVLKQRLRIPDSARPGDMEVSFIPFIWMKYRLLYMSDDYRFMVVGSSSMNLLWLMSREANPSSGEYEALKVKAASLGYDTAKLERVSQSGN